MAFGEYEIMKLVEGTSRVNVWGFTVSVEVDDVTVDEVDDDEYEIEVDFRAYGRATVKGNIDMSKLKKVFKTLHKCY